MRIRESKEDDRHSWDTFVDSQEGSFNFYFDCRYVDKNIHQLLIENDQSQLIGVCNVERQERLLYSSIRMNGILFRKDERDDEKYRATLDTLAFIEKNYSKGISTFIVTEEIKLGSENNNGPRDAFVDCKFILRNGCGIDLPCSHVLPLKKPFEEHIWKGLWSQKFRQALNKVDKNGVKVIQDRELIYLEPYIEMLTANYKRHGQPPPNRAHIIAECNVFKAKTKLFVALLDERPIVILNCHYSPSTCFLSQVGSYNKGTDDSNKYCYKAAIEDACNNGYKYADFGHSYTEGLASLKDRYKFSRIPIRVYEKRYSVPRVFAELTMGFIQICVHNRAYIWRERTVIWNRIVHW